MQLSDYLWFRWSTQVRLAITLTFFFLVVAVAAALAQSPSRGQGSPPIFGGAVPQAGGSLSGVAPGNAHLWALDVEQNLYFRSACGGALRSIGRLRQSNGQPLETIIGIDFRPADGRLYALGLSGRFYVLQSVFAYPVDGATIVPFGGGFQSLFDWNPQVNAVRLIGSDDTNFAVVNNFSAFAQQGTIAYAAGDVNAGRNVGLSGGSYTNSYLITPSRPAPAITLFFGLDYQSQGLVWIPPAAAGQSSATGGGQVQTIGRLQGFLGTLPITPLSDGDIYQDASGRNQFVGITGNTLFAFDVDALVIPPLGQTTPVIVRTAPLLVSTLIDVAVGFDARGCGQ